MAVLQISTREFRDRQAAMLDMADRGENVVIRRGNKAYVITPISDDDLYFTPEILWCLTLTSPKPLCVTLLG